MFYQPLDASTVRVRWLSLPGLQETFFHRWRTILNAVEIEQADRFHFASDRNAYIAAHALLRTMLSEAANRPPASWDYITGRNGKPSLALERAEGTLHFSITHTRGVVACAVCGDHEVGIDAETAKGWRGDPEMISREFSPGEIELVGAAPPSLRHEVFFRIWTLKESFVKATGEGLYRPLASFAFRLDPVEITFHPSAKAPDRLADPGEWQFAEFRPTSGVYLAATANCGNAQVVFDAAAISASGMAP